MSRNVAAALCLLLAACGTTYQVPVADGAAPAAPVAQRTGGKARTPADFRRVAARVEPVAEKFCREERGGAGKSCDFAIGLETDPRMPPNAFQTLNDEGRPIIVVSAALLDQMTSDDEIAFVLSHEASHQIAQHISKQQQQSILGAMVMGGLVVAAGGYGGMGASDEAVQQAMDLGAAVGGRAYSQTYELEADTLGAFIAARAGYDPERGALLFTSPALAGGGALLSTHPASAQRMATVARVAAEIRRQKAAGLDPRPEYAEGLF
ncbi:M48 family metalloprotease [Amaricoccus sp.]|uniref:M48 family metalloprotease n=1 Tax=Amaricoccus sp. TaxID=1872485 RepID=UPI00261DB3DA|nr:M48 family metalloprotease [uncultured Amaricoccus sp.]